MTKEQEFKAELAALLEKYEAEIYVQETCASEMFGYYYVLRAKGKDFKVWSEKSTWQAKDLK